jgi:hypothetical protein
MGALSTGGRGIGKGHEADSHRLVPRMCGAMPPYAFMACTGTTILYHKNNTAIMFMKNTSDYPA